MTYYWATVSFLLGAVIGSFLNVVIYRLPRGESLVRPGSHCPACGAAIKWYDNVPLFSWLLLRGRCRQCRETISLRYPAVEFLTGAIFALTFWRLDASWELLMAWAFVASAIVLAFVYYDHSVVPGRLLWPIVTGGFALSVALNPGRAWANVVTGLAAAVFTVGVSCLARRRKGMVSMLKISDVGVAFLVAVVLGFSTLLALAVTLFLGLFFVLYLHRRQGSLSSIAIRFAPLLCIGAVVALLTGEFIVDGYTSFYH